MPLPQRTRYALIALALLLAACARTPDEVLVRAQIDAAVAAAEAADARAFVKVLDADFTGNDGELDRQRIRQLLLAWHLRQEKVGVLLGPISVEARGERLVAEFTATLRGGGRLLPDQLGVYAVSTAWRRDGGDWRCYSATWKQKL